MPLSVAILGAGYIADWHCRALRGKPIVAVCDRAPARASALAARYSIPRAFTDLGAMLAEAKPDVVHVLLPPDRHFAAAEQVLRAGAHALLEKPMALTAGECHTLAELAREHFRSVGVSHNFLFAPVYERLRTDVRAGKLGRLDQVTITWNRELGQVRGGPFGGWLFRDPANVMLEVGPHSAAHLLDLVGEPDRLTAEADRSTELPTGAPFFRRWRARAHVGETVVDLNWSFEAGVTEHVIHVRGSAGVATADLERGTYHLNRGGTTGVEDLDRYTATAGEARTLLRQARNVFGRYVLSKFKLSRRGSLFGTGIERAIEAFYDGLSANGDERLGAAFAGRVVDLCRRIGAVASRERKLAEHLPTVAPGAGAPGSPKAPDCLVLGGAGFIGRALVHRLVTAGRSVRLLVRDRAGLPRVLRDLPLDIMAGDVGDPDDVDRAMAGVRDVFHLARGNGTTYEEFLRTDLDPTEIVAAACLTHGVRRLVYTSTIDALDTSRSRIIADDVWIDSRFYRRKPYSRAKAESERRLMELYADRGLPVVILRPGIVLGVGTSPFHWGVAWWPAPAICRLWGRGKNPLPLVMVDDVARAIARAAEVEGIDGESFNLVAETNITAADYVAVLAGATGTSMDVRPRTALRHYLTDLTRYLVKVLVRHPGRRLPSYHDWAARGQYARFDCRKAKRLLGWQPVTDRETLLREGVERPAAEWVK
jgi:predicted dehydrogenase/nucleoside-diphosphate-sugar epimerase